MFGYTFPLEEFVTQITLEQFNQSLQMLQAENCSIVNIPHQVDSQSQSMVRTALESSGLASDIQRVFNQLMVREYGYCITK